MVKEWDNDQLLKWIQQKRPKLLQDVEDIENFKAAQIPGDVFLTLAGDAQFFKKECHLPIGPSEGLADLASEIGEGVKQQFSSTKGGRRVCGAPKQGKLLSFIPYSKH
jgi:hypothetical protein